MDNAIPRRRTSQSLAAEAVFRARLAELGATLLESRWLGHRRPHLVLCAAGHECTPRPNNVQQGWGICRICAGHDPATAEANFRKRLAELGATLLEPAWLGKGKPHRVRCIAGHFCTPRPTSVQRGNGICRVCARQDPATAEAAFRERLKILGATLLEPAYLGTDVPHRAVCAEGHLCTPRPHSVQQGQGICFTCSRSAQDALYVVRHIVEPYVKFGITNGDGRDRLGDHARAGYRGVLRYYRGLPKVAAEIEQAAIRALADAGMRPVKGREYYDVAALALILDVIDGWAAGRGTANHATKEDR